MRKAFWCMILLLIISANSASSQIRYDKIDYYVYLFVKNTEWPAKVLKDTFLIGVIGDTRANAKLLRLANKQKLKGFPTELRIFKSQKEVGFSHLLFVPSKYSDNFHKVIPHTNPSTLVITESIGHALAGSSINIIWEDEFSGKMHFEVNRAAFEKGGLRMSSDLSKNKIR